MKRYKLIKLTHSSTDGHYAIVVDGDTHLNRGIIKSSITFFTTSPGFSRVHPEQTALDNATAMMDGLNRLERRRENKTYKPAKYK